MEMQSAPAKVQITALDQSTDMPVGVVSRETPLARDRASEAVTDSRARYTTAARSEDRPNERHDGGSSFALGQSGFYGRM